MDLQYKSIDWSPYYGDMNLICVNIITAKSEEGLVALWCNDCLYSTISLNEVRTYPAKI